MPVSALPELLCQVEISRASSQAVRQCHFQMSVWISQIVIKFILIDLLLQKSKHRSLVSARQMLLRSCQCLFFCIDLSHLQKTVKSVPLLL